MKNINTITLNRLAYQDNQIIEEVDLAFVPWETNTMDSAFLNCQNLTNVTNINGNVTNMINAFANCINLVNAPVIPSSVTDMSLTFSGCFKLVNAPEIPNSVTNMCNTFINCDSLNIAPVIPNSVVDMSGTFGYCFKLVNAPEIPNSVTNMCNTFQWCTNLVNAPVIPSSVTDMSLTFSRCFKLVNAPEIPNSVTNMYYTFWDCYNLTGDINILSENISNATNCFYNAPLNKDVYIPFKNNDVYTQTYNSFINAGYSTTERVNGVRLFDLNGPDIDLSDYEYTIDEQNNVTLTKYIGSNIDIVTPHL